MAVCLRVNAPETAKVTEPLFPKNSVTQVQKLCNLNVDTTRFASMVLAGFD
jgi:hypothetical protein